MIWPQSSALDMGGLSLSSAPMQVWKPIQLTVIVMPLNKMQNSDVTVAPGLSTPCRHGRLSVHCVLCTLRNTRSCAHSICYQQMCTLPAVRPYARPAGSSRDAHL